MSGRVELAYEPSVHRRRRYFDWLAFICVLIAGSGPAVFRLITPSREISETFRFFDLPLSPITNRALAFVDSYARYGWLWVPTLAVLAGLLTAIARGAGRRNDRSTVVAWLLASLLTAACTLIFLQRAIEAQMMLDLPDPVSGGGGIK